ncbi:hypothetical protein QTA57_08205 [Fontisubflavum oceani]|uniref:hypothetical protein n=1 Tax=Fontisubflavum oceani TaxID=2978973 RepID=UPI0025B58232|nr:hypothetical protein [Fontisubflavum oceani]WJY23044.1 hypothetical protein QTA57_08205 [Fontisubflavum oceani]
MQTYLCNVTGVPQSGNGDCAAVYEYPFRFVSRHTFPALTRVVHNDDEFLECLKLHAEAEDVFLKTEDLEAIVEWATFDPPYVPTGPTKQASCVDPAWYVY